MFSLFLSNDYSFDKVFSRQVEGNQKASKMSFNKAKIFELIHQGENTSVEFKDRQVRAESLAKEVVAFANSYGGTLLIGVADNGMIQGISDQKNYEEWIANIARNNVIPSISTDFFLVTVEDKKIAVILVPKG